MSSRGEPRRIEPQTASPMTTTRTRSPARQPSGTRRMRAHGVGSARCRGADAIAFLHGQLSSDVEALAPGQGQYWSYNSPKGRMLANGVLWRGGYGSGPRADGAGRRSRRADPPAFVDVRAALEGRRSTMAAALWPAGRGGAPMRRRRRTTRWGRVEPMTAVPFGARGQRARATGRPHPRFMPPPRAVRSFTPRWRATPRLPTPKHGAGSASLPACR